MKIVGNLKIQVIGGVDVGTEYELNDELEQGLYLINKSIWIKTNANEMMSIWMGLDDYFDADLKTMIDFGDESAPVEMPSEDILNDISADEIAFIPEEDTETEDETLQHKPAYISEDLLLKAIAVSQNPHLAFANE